MVRYTIAHVPHDSIPYRKHFGTKSDPLIIGSLIEFVRRCLYGMPRIIEPKEVNRKPLGTSYYPVLCKHAAPVMRFRIAGSFIDQPDMSAHRSSELQYMSLIHTCYSTSECVNLLVLVQELDSVAQALWRRSF